MRSRVVSEFLVVLCLGGALAAPTWAESPNVVLLLADDLGWGDVGYHGSAIETPNIDRLASEGIQLDRMYTAPICTPTRAMLLTGRDPLPMGLAYDQINPWNNVGLHPDEHLMPESFRTAGYQTAMVGKWHLGHSIEQHVPNSRGFDYFYGHLHTAVDYYTHQRRNGHDWQRNGKSISEKGRYATDLEGEDAARWIRARDKNRPFFLYVPFTAPHSPMQAPDELIAKYAALPEQNNRQVYAAMVESMDRAVGRILAALDDEGIADQTIVLFMSDNGGSTVFGGVNTPLRGQKGQAFEGGIRVPAVLRWPDGQGETGRISQQMLSAMDVFPTLAAAAGVATHNSRPLDGTDRWQMILSGEVKARTQPLLVISEIPVPGLISLAVFDREWKLVQTIREQNTQMTVRSMLFRIESDPHEQNDLAQEHPEVVAHLAEIVDQWRGTHPLGGLRTTLVPHPGWLPPKDWATAVVPAKELQPKTGSEWNFGALPKIIGRRGSLEE